MGFQERGRRQLVNTVGSIALIGFAAFPSVACGSKDTGASVLHPAQAAEQKTERFRSLSVPYELQYPPGWTRGENSPAGLKETIDTFNGPEIDGINIVLGIRTAEYPIG